MPVQIPDHETAFVPSIAAATEQHRTSARTPAEAARNHRTLEALRAARRSDERSARRLRDRVVEEHIDVAEAVAGRYIGHPNDRSDLMQVACLGLVKAADRFDPRRGDDFVAFAVPTMRGEIKRYLRDSSSLVRPPRRLQELRIAQAHARDELAARSSSEPSNRDLAAYLGCTVPELLEARRSHGESLVVSLDTPLASDDGATLGAQLGFNDPAFERVEECVLVRSILKTLTQRERTVLGLRFGEELSQLEIGRRLGITQMQVSRILGRVLCRLRVALGVESDLLTAAELTAAKPTDRLSA